MFERSAPESWSELSLNEMGIWISGKTPSKSRGDFWKNGSIPWISPKDMKKPFLNESEDLITEKAVKEGGMKILPSGSILIVVRSGILAHTLPVGVTKVDVTVNQDIKAIKPANGISEVFVMHFLKSKQSQ